MAIDDAVVDTIKARLLMMNKTLDVWHKIWFFSLLHIWIPIIIISAL